MDIKTARYAVSDAEKRYAEYIPQAIEAVVPVNRRADYRMGRNGFYAPASHHAKANVRKILDLARELWLKDNGELYRVEFSGTVDVYAEGGEQAELTAEGRISVSDMYRYVRKLDKEDDNE